MDGFTAVLTEGGMGSGKSYFRGCRHVVDYLLPETGYKIITNIPLDTERVADWITARRKKLDRKAIIDRIHIIPKDVQVAWEDGRSNPVDYLTSCGLENSYIIIDEAHHFWPDGGDKKRIHGFKAFISTLRHEKAQIELISQSSENIHASVRRLIQIKYVIIPNETRRLPILGIKLGDIYEIWAGFVSGEYDSSVRIEERIKQGRRFILENTSINYRDPTYFGLYDTHGGVVRENDEDDAEIDADGNPKNPVIYEFQKRSKSGLLWWFIKRNWFRSTLCTIGLTAAILFFFGGGIDYAIPAVMGKITGAMKLSGQPAKPQKELADSTEKVKENPTGEADVLKNDVTQLLLRIAELSEKSESLSVENKTLQKELEVQKIKEKSLTTRINEFVEKISKASEIVLLSKNGAILNDGQSIKTGEKIKSEKYQDRIVSQIDQKNGSIILDDGAELRISDRLQTY